MSSDSDRIAVLEQRLEGLTALISQRPDDAPTEQQSPVSVPRTRRQLLGLAGTAAAGAAVASLVTTKSAAAADGQAILMGTSGDLQNHMTSPTTVVADAGSYGAGYVLEVNGSNATLANGIRALGGYGAAGLDAIASGSNGVGVKGTGAGSSANGGPGISGVGAGFAPGVVGRGGSNAASGDAGRGVEGYGSSSGTGAGSVGVYGKGGSGGPGQTNGPGVFGSAGEVSTVGAPANAGVVGTGYYFPGIYGYSFQSHGGVFQGGLSNITLLPAGTAGPPAIGPHARGDVWMDSAGLIWACIGDGTPGAFVPVQTGGLNEALFTAVSTHQYQLINSDGVTWADIDTNILTLTITPLFNCQALLSGSADLWTSVAGFNQDFAIFISGGTYGAGQIVAWKESGGFAGTFSPNAAFVTTVQRLVAGTTYTVKLRWKANRAGTSTIWAGAGPIPAGSSTFSPTSLTGYLITSF